MDYIGSQIASSGLKLTLQNDMALMEFNADNSADEITVRIVKNQVIKYPERIKLVLMEIGEGFGSHGIQY